MCCSWQKKNAWTEAVGGGKTKKPKKQRKRFKLETEKNKSTCFLAALCKVSENQLKPVSWDSSISAPVLESERIFEPPRLSSLPSIIRSGRLSIQITDRQTVKRGWNTAQVHFQENKGSWVMLIKPTFVASQQIGAGIWSKNRQHLNMLVHAKPINGYLRL